MKKGVKRIKPAIVAGYLVPEAERGLACLKEARRVFQQIGASSTLARVNYAISSAKGAVRAASYRETRLQRSTNPHGGTT